MRRNVHIKFSDLTTISLALLGFSCLGVMSASAAERSRQIEEVIVTAEKVEATVSDTSISITAFPEDAIKDFGMQGADDMVNYIPATTRDAYDIRIRGVGRNFRALGGDPGVATYYNGVYSPDFGIAASENALYDVNRIEVLRGPQGTLYGRNSIGGALNYITNDPTFDWSGNVRAQFGEYNDREAYATISGPLIADTLAMRLVGVKRDRDGTQEGILGSIDTDSTDDSNFTAGLTWNITDNLTMKVRGNDRHSSRVIPASVVITTGAGPERGLDSSAIFANGFRSVLATDPGAIAFNDPITGTTVYGAHVRPGIDVAASYLPNEYYGHPEFRQIYAGATKDDPNHTTMVNPAGPGECAFPYTVSQCQHELFDHRASQNEITWDISDSLSVKYLFGTNDFEYTFNLDGDYVNADITRLRYTVLEDVQSKSHEIQFFWNPSEDFTLTTGFYYFDELRKQDYSITNTTPRITQAANYGLLAPTIGFLQSIGALSATPIDSGYDAPLGRTLYGPWGGNARGDTYHHDNTTTIEATAVYSQGTWQINDQFALVLGLRYAKDKKTADEVRSFYFEDGAGAFTGGAVPLGTLNALMGNSSFLGVPTCALDDVTCTTPLRLQGLPLSGGSHIQGEDEWSDTNYRVNLDWTPTDDTLVYFSVTTGYRAGGYTLGTASARVTDATTGLLVPLPYDQEEVTSFEIGYKSAFIDNTMQLNMSLYTYDYTGYQDNVNVFDADRGAVVDVVKNAPKAKNTGFEAEVLWLPTDALTVGGNMSYTKAEYTADYFIAITDDPDHPASLFGNGQTNPALFLVNANGSQLKKIPKEKATVWAQYLIETGFGGVTLGGTYSYTGEYYDEGIEREIDRVPEQGRLDLTVTWRDVAEDWRVQVFARNITDENNLRDVSTGTESSNFRMSGAILQPRFVGVDITYSFGDH